MLVSRRAAARADLARVGVSGEKAEVMLARCKDQSYRFRELYRGATDSPRPVRFASSRRKDRYSFSGDAVIGIGASSEADLASGIDQVDGAREMSRRSGWSALGRGRAGLPSVVETAEWMPEEGSLEDEQGPNEIG